MPAPVEVTAFIPTAQLKELQRVLDPLVLRRITASAINDAVRFGRTQVSRAVRAELNIKAKDLNELIVTDKATITRQFGRITLGRKPSPMRIFGARQTRRGVTVKPRKGQPRELLRGAFIIQKYGGHVFRRRGKERGPLRMEFGPTGVGVLAGKLGLLRAQTQIIYQKFQERLASKVQAHLEGKAFGVLGENVTQKITERLSRQT